jgi:hypothetical protein
MRYKRAIRQRSGPIVLWLIVCTAVLLAGCSSAQTCPPPPSQELAAPPPEWLIRDLEKILGQPSGPASPNSTDTEH